MKKNTFHLFIFVGLAVMLGIAAFFFVRKLMPALPETPGPTNSSSPAERLYMPNPELEASYETSLRSILNEFTQGADAQVIRGKILGLTVPDKYKPVHLDLIIAFDQVILGRESSDQAKIEAALEAIGEIEESNPWMR